MTLQLKPNLQKYVDEQVQSGSYDSADEVVAAGLAALQQQKREVFGPGELDKLLAEGLADIERGDLHDGEAVFRELDELSATRRSEKIK
jgi:antitoxin ParD1/3/4